MTLFKAIVDEIGWLAPNGDFYPVVVDGNFGDHKTLAADIIREVYKTNPDALELKDYELLSWKVYEFLKDRGWVRVDTETIEPECGLTFEQLVTLSKMLRKSVRGGVNRDKIQKVLDRHNTEECLEGTLVPHEMMPTSGLIEPPSPSFLTPDKDELWNEGRQMYNAQYERGEFSAQIEAMKAEGRSFTPDEVQRLAQGWDDALRDEADQDMLLDDMAAEGIDGDA